MFLVGLLQWWYGRGWISQLVQAKQRLMATLDFFSVDQLLLTLFAPFRQISASNVHGSASVVLRAFFDKTISRLIGAFVRLWTILFGSALLVVQAVVELVIIVIWLLIPLFPIVGFILFAIGWVPSWT